MNAEQLAAALDRLGLGPVKAASALGVNRSALWRWTKGTAPIPAIAVKLVEALLELQALKAAPSTTDLTAAVHLLTERVEALDGRVEELESN